MYLSFLQNLVHRLLIYGKYAYSILKNLVSGIVSETPEYERIPDWLEPIIDINSEEEQKEETEEERRRRNRRRRRRRNRRRRRRRRKDFYGFI